jgi:hypothetical protein
VGLARTEGAVGTQMFTVVCRFDPIVRAVPAPPSLNAAPKWLNAAPRPPSDVPEHPSSRRGGRW